jgi:cytochrome c peroxidase
MEPRSPRNQRWQLAVLLCAGLLGACGGSGEKATQLSAPAALGEKIFNDVSLSASGQLACASCHSARRGHAPDNDLSAQFGGPALENQGGRSAPSIRYLASNAAFRFDADGAPGGGFFWDGRAASLQDQASRPFLNGVEMANTSPEDVVAKLSRAAYADDFRRVFGDDIFSRAGSAFERMTLALQQYQREEAEFQPFSSKYDEFLRGKVALSEQELRGLAFFNSPAKGNCAACHPSAKAVDGSHPLFTDFSYDALGVPRNPALLANQDPNHFDLGLCTREGGDLNARGDLCGAFKVPSLRNVAQRGTFFHNGRFTSLREALTFYVQRDTQPEKWYPRRADGGLEKFDDLPERYRANVNTSEAPYNRRPGEPPALSDAEIDDLIAFLKTLSDADTR